jgi:hypothetical protein
MSMTDKAGFDVSVTPSATTDPTQDFGCSRPAMYRFYLSRYFDHPAGPNVDIEPAG